MDIEALTEAGGSWQHRGFPSFWLDCGPSHISGIGAPLALNHIELHCLTVTHSVLQEFFRVMVLTEFSQLPGYHAC